MKGLNWIRLDWNKKATPRQVTECSDCPILDECKTRRQDHKVIACSRKIHDEVWGGD